MPRKCLRCSRNELHNFRHGTSNAYSYHDCRCGECVAFMRQQVISWRDLNPEKRTAGSHHTEEQRRSYYQRNRASFRRGDQVTRERFSRAVGKPPRRAWTQDEDAMALRDDLTLLEIAYLLGRNRGSILYRRSVLRKEMAA